MPRFTEVETRILQKYIQDHKLYDSLILIRGVMENIWANDAPRIVTDYTDHGEEHSKKIIFFAEKLLQVNPAAKFSQQEIYLLLASIYLHDIGMQCDIVKYPEIKKKAEDLGAKFEEVFTAKTTSGYSLEEQKEIRKNHNFLTAAWIEYLYEKKDPVLSHGIRSVPYDFVDDLMDVCKFHSKLSIDDCPDYFSGDPSSRKKMVSSLIRFADELDISSTRVNIETVKIFSLTLENSIYWWLHNYTKIDFVNTNKVHLKVNLHPEDFDKYGSFIRESYITKFKLKNQPVLNVLVEQKIPVVIDNNSDVVVHKRAEKFPSEITAVLDKNIKNSCLSSRSKIPAFSRNLGSKTVEFASVDPEDKKINAIKAAEIHTVSIPETPHIDRRIVCTTTKSFAIKEIINHEMKWHNIIIKNTLFNDDALTLSKTIRTFVGKQRTITLDLCSNDFFDEYFDVNKGYETFIAFLDLPDNLPVDAPIEITFSIYHNGVFEITSKDLTRNKEIHVTIPKKYQNF